MSYTYLFAHMPRQASGKRAKAGIGMCAQANVTADSEAGARKWFRDTYPDREIISSGVAGQSA